MRIPRATYRLQLGPEMGFARVREIVPYLERLGISDLYLSPILKSRSDVTHGYHVTDPTQLDPRLGPRSDLEALADDLRARDMGIVADIVPNHMAASRENAWWWDVLQKGADSQFARIFDVDWERGDGKVVLPLDEVPERGCYRRVDWRSPERNYRRFFDIDDLVAVRQEDPWVFDVTHSLVLDLVSSGIVTGLRIDHLDGLRDPAGYLARLPSDVYVVVEKILQRDEEPLWPTTGYDFIDHADGLLVDRGGVRGAGGFTRIAEAAKRQVVEDLFSSEVDALAERLRASRDDIVEKTVALNVYRTYGSKHPEWEQLTGPVMAKGHEDTALYRFPLLISRNEVGADPARPTIAPRDFPEWAAKRSSLSLNPGSTHDTKRGEDVRARINVLSEIRPDWDETVGRWMTLYEGPSDDDKHLFFQTLVGAWPIDAQRMREVMGKSIREAKLHTNWREPNAGYERAVDEFVNDVFTDTDLTAEVEQFVKRIDVPGRVNSLAGVVLRVAAPGIPDVYQGSETWYLRLVDPDNRVPVDFAELETSLGDSFVPAYDARAKQFVLQRALGIRAQKTDVFRSGTYMPLDVRGPMRRHIVAFARRLEGDWVIAVVPRLVANIGEAGRFPLENCWRGTRIVLPPDAPARWRNVLTDDELSALDVAEVLRDFPVALLVSL